MTATALRSFTSYTPLREATFKSDGGPLPSAARVVLITEGEGNRRDRNYYSGDALRNSYKAFEGRKSFLDHPSKSEEQDLPERSVTEQCGWLANVELGSLDGRTAILADLVFGKNTAASEARSLIESALQYQAQYPAGDDVFVGLSINASGPSHEELIGGEAWNVVEGIESVFSVDLVTFPARGGKALAFKESQAFRRAFESQVWRDRFTAVLRVADAA